MKKYFRYLAAAAVCAGLCQAASVATPNQTSKPAAARRTLSDAEIERNIKARLAKSKMTLSGKEHFTVTVKDGVATLEGKSNVIQHKGVATRLAKLGGAVAVKNNIEISPEARAKALAHLQQRNGAPASGPPRATVVQAQTQK